MNPYEPSRTNGTRHEVPGARPCRIASKSTLKLLLVGMIAGVASIVLIGLGMILLLASNLLLLIPMGPSRSTGLDLRAHLSAILFGAYFVLAIVLAGNVIREQLYSPGYNLEHLLMITLPAMFLSMYASIGIQLCRSHNLSLRSSNEG